MLLCQVIEIWRNDFNQCSIDFNPWIYHRINIRRNRNIFTRQFLELGYTLYICTNMHVYIWVVGEAEWVKNILPAFFCFSSWKRRLRSILSASDFLIMFRRSLAVFCTASFSNCSWLTTRCKSVISDLINSLCSSAASTSKSYRRLPGFIKYDSQYINSISLPIRENYLKKNNLIATTVNIEKYTISKQNNCGHLK